MIGVKAGGGLAWVGLKSGVGGAGRRFHVVGGNRELLELRVSEGGTGSSRDCGWVRARPGVSEAVCVGVEGRGGGVAHRDSQGVRAMEVVKVGRFKFRYLVVNRCRG